MQEKIRTLAYRLWQEAGSPQGRDLEHWLAAEAQLTQAPVKPKAPKPPAKPKAADASAKPKAADASAKPKAADASKTPGKARAARKAPVKP